MKRKLLLLLLLLAIITIPIKRAQASIASYTKGANTVNFKLDKGCMQVNILRADMVQVKYTIFNSFPAHTSLVINNSWQQQTLFKISETAAEVVISTSRLKIKVNKATNAITYTDLSGYIITSEYRKNKTMTPVTIAGINTYTCESEFNSPASEALFGLGCHPEDTLSINYKGRNQSMAIKYMTGAIPVLLSTKGYGLMWDNYSASQFLGAEGGNTRFKYVSESGKTVDYYFFYGPDFDHIIDLYRTATGRAPMFPKWSFGLFQSQDRYKSEAEILTVADNYRKNHIPVDAIVQDWYYWDPLPIGSHIMTPDRYPHPKQMVDALHKANIHAMISIWPLFGKNTNNYDAMKSKGFLTDITWDNVVTHTFDSYYDAHNPKARALYWEQARDSLIARYGWDAWWVDQCEPDNGTLLDERRKSNFSVGKGIDYFNTYSLEHSKGLYKGWREDIPGKRAFFLVRQAFAGQQRNATTLWSSDITCTFRAFKSQVPQGINACVAGIPYWTSDIGGYHYNWNAPDWAKPEFRELFTRWFQFGAFSPIFRIHGKGERALFSDNWDAKTKAILLNYDKLRYRLLPYIYSLAGNSTTNNYTMMRSLGFDFRNDPKVYNIPDQYMFGPAFLVNPVTDQLYSGKNAAQGKTTRSVYLPAATQWYDFWTGQQYKGGQAIDADAPIDKMPLYVRAGSIIPMGTANIEYATEKPDAPIELRIYPGANGTFKFYEDANDGYQYEKGEFATFTLNWTDKTSTLTITGTKGKFAGMLKKHVFKIVKVNGAHGSNTAVTNKADKAVNYYGKPISIKI